MLQGWKSPEFSLVQNQKTATKLCKAKGTKLDRLGLRLKLSLQSGSDLYRKEKVLDTIIGTPVVLRLDPEPVACQQF